MRIIDGVKVFEKLRTEFEGSLSEEPLIGLVHVVENHVRPNFDLLKWYRPSNEEQRLLLDSLVEHAMAAERMCPGGFKDVVLRVLTNADEHDLTSLVATSKCFEKKDVPGLITGANLPEIDLLRDVGQILKMDRSLMVIRDSRERVVIEDFEGYDFDLQSPTHERFDEHHVKCLMIDGYIENVSEIHHLLHAAVEQHATFVVFARGFHPDVERTVRVNVEAGRMKVILVHVPLDLEHANTLVDLACIAGDDVVSADKGQLIHSVTTNTLKVLDRVTYRRNRLIVENSATRDTVKKHVADLRKRIDANPATAHVLDSRIRALGGGCTRVLVPAGKEFDHIELILDFFLRTISLAAQHGVVATKRGTVPLIRSIASEFFSKKFLMSLSNVILTQG